MLEIQLSLSNDEAETVGAWLAGLRSGLTDDMIAPVPTRKTDRATVCFAFCDHVLAAIDTHQTLLKEKERAAREARKGK